MAVGCCANIGTTSKNRFWMNLDAGGIFCSSMCYVLILYSMFATYYAILVPLLGGLTTIAGFINCFLYNSLCIIAIYCHYKTMTTDPGAVPPDARPLVTDLEEITNLSKSNSNNDVESNSNDVNGDGGNINYFSDNDNDVGNIRNRERFDSITSVDMNSRQIIESIRVKPMSPNKVAVVWPYKKYCKRCKSFKPKRAHHCSICNRCVIKMDHHCPWMNNCIGIGNHKLFLLFLLYITVISIYALLLIIAKYTYCFTATQPHVCGTDYHNNLIIFLLVESLLFGMFTICMMSDQVSVISSGNTQIDRLKSVNTYVKHEVNEVFGGSSDDSFTITWLMPIPVKFDGLSKDNIFGYRSFLCGVSELTPFISMTTSINSSDTKSDNAIRKRVPL